MLRKNSLFKKNIHPAFLCLLLITSTFSQKKRYKGHFNNETFLHPYDFHNISCPVVVVDVLRVYRLPHIYKGHRSDDEINICRHICVCLNVLLIFSSSYDELFIE